MCSLAVFVFMFHTPAAALCETQPRKRGSHQEDWKFGVQTLSQTFDEWLEPGYVSLNVNFCVASHIFGVATAKITCS